ncbi:putative membrane protein At3g27390 [Bidens hawaiensis]|uniref:putative membrane protein At3g27390 n=1 Tax=Bidens hawaiensis TaxID=980011 RepID=UPI00404B4197
MEPPKGVWKSLGQFILFLPYFVGLLGLGFIKGIILAPIICIIMTIGNSAVVIGLWPAHVVWTYFCILSAKRLGPVMKVVMVVLFTPVLASWPVAVVVGSILGGLAYGFLGPMFGTFKAVGEGKTDQFKHCIIDGTWDTFQWSFTFIRDLKDVCLYSYFSLMRELKEGRPEGKIEIRVVYLPMAIMLGVLGLIVDFPLITIIAALKSPYMLLKGWRRLFQDCIGREGPFLETICVPFAGLAILLWPLAVAGALLASMLSGIALGLYAAIIVYQEYSFFMGLRYIVAALSIFDEYSNDVLDMPEGSCFPNPKYRRNPGLSASSSFSRAGSLKKTPSRSGSVRNPMIELKPLELLDSFFQECRRQGEFLVLNGLMTVKEIEDPQSVILPAYCLYQSLLRSAKTGSPGIIMSENGTEITLANRPKDTFYDWFLNPLLVIKDQIKASNLSEPEEVYLGKLVLLIGNPQKLKNADIGPPPASELRRAELEAIARRLQGITKSISRYPTYRRKFENIMKVISEELDKRDGGSYRGPQTVPRSKSTFGRLFSVQRSFKFKSSTGDNHNGGWQEDARDVDIV